MTGQLLKLARWLSGAMQKFWAAPNAHIEHSGPLDAPSLMIVMIRQEQMWIPSQRIEYKKCRNLYSDPAA
jgi:hypothetical protein